MLEFPFDGIRGLAAIVGSFHGMHEEPPVPEQHVAVLVDGVPDAGAMGLAEDARLLIEAFVRDPAACDREKALAAAAPDPDGDLDIALHGLHLGPEDQRVLAGLVRDLVRARRAPQRTER
jgi:hypothetical protein